ncbi:MAG: TIGR04282 family arsenosugar biosynthesis glycosyltransferase [Rhodospirillales bacterium]|nr:TIGR04282 family arsenosugar biosynthesis glycosyltransferase [Rhodospirillales bacterium]
MPIRNHLVIMIKEPRLGKVKTRLAREIGAVAATRFYRNAATQLIRRLSNDRRWQCWLQITPDTKANIPVSWRKNCRIIYQGHGDLGQRMMRPMYDLPPGPAVLIGSDIPAVQPYHIAKAFKLLGNNSLVFGPAQDGGFWLVGQKRTRNVIKLFDNVRWSTENTLTDSTKSLRWAKADLLSDVDDAISYHNWRANVPGKINTTLGILSPKIKGSAVLCGFG